jgi:hypothetical protein
MTGSYVFTIRQPHAALIMAGFKTGRVPRGPCYQEARHHIGARSVIHRQTLCV